MADSSYWDAAVRRLKDIQEDWLPPRRTAGIQTTTSRPAFSSGIITSSSGGWGSGIWNSVEEATLHAKFRVVHVTSAINDSFPAAFAEIETRLGGISIDAIKDVLRNMLKDVALILGGSTVLGSGIGAAVGAFAFGVGAVPGAAIGATAGFEMGNLILTFTGLKSIATFMAGAVPAAIRCYGDGFREAWGDREGKAKWAHIAYKDFAKGHVLFVMAILMGIVGYLMRGKGNFPILMGEIRASAKLGPKFADWITTNQEALMRNPALQQGMRASAGAGAAESEAPAIAPQGPIRGQTPTNLVDPNAPIRSGPLAPSQLAPVQSVWNMNPLARGRAIEDRLAETDYADWYRVGAERNGKFPLVDFQNGNDLVSLKTADTTGSSWMSDMRDHIRDLDRFRGTVDGNPADMYLDLRVQPGGLADAQPLVQYGAKYNVTVLTQEYP